MKMKFKILASSLALALAGQASAALDLPTSNNSSLWLTVWDTSIGATKSYTRNLGLNLNSFLPNSLSGDKTPESGLTLNFASDALFASTFTGISSSNLAWNVFGGDAVFGGANGQARVIVTAPTATANSPSITRASVVNAGVNSDFFATNLLANWGCNTANSCAVNDPTVDGAGQGPRWGAGVGGAIPFNTSGSVGSLLNFYYFAANSAAFGQAESKVAFANSLGRATWTMDANGNATYNLEGVSAVPVPAAVWLLGSGLVGLVGVARRRRESV